MQTALGLLMDKIFYLIVGILISILIILATYLYNYSNQIEELEEQKKVLSEFVENCELQKEECKSILKILEFDLYVKELENNETINKDVNLSDVNGTKQWMY